MAVYNEHINIMVDDHAVTRARANVQQLQSLCKNIKMNIGGDSKLSNFNSRMQSIQRNTRSTVQELQKLNQSFNSIKGGDGIKSIAESLKALAKEEEIITKKKIKIDVKLKGAEDAISKLKELSSEVSNLNSKKVSIDVNTRGMNRQLQRDTQRYAQQYNRGVPIGNSRYGNYYPRNMNGTTGNGHKMDIFGFNADNSMAYQYGSAFRKQGQTLNNMTEKFNRVNDAFLTFGMYLGTRDLTNTILETPARAETQKWLLGEMQQGQTTTDASGKEATLYQILDKTTDMLPISMQNVANPLYALQSSTGATAQQLADAIPIWANFGANVINMTGSEERAETAMEKLSYAFNGQYAGTDQFGISEASLNAHGFDTKTMSGKAEYLPEFLHAVEEITPDATKSMNNFNGQKMLVSKDFARAGKRLWNDGLGPVLTTIVGGFHQYDMAMQGIPTTLMTAASAAITFGTTLTGVIGPTVQMIGMWGQLSGSLRAAHQNGGIISNLWKTLRGGNAALKGQPFGWGNPFVSGGDGVFDGEVSSPQLASIDGSVKTIAGEVASQNVKEQRMGRYKQHKNGNIETEGTYYDSKHGIWKEKGADRQKLKEKYKDKHSVYDPSKQAYVVTDKNQTFGKKGAVILDNTSSKDPRSKNRMKDSLKERVKNNDLYKISNKRLSGFTSGIKSSLSGLLSWNTALVGGTILMLGASVAYGIAYANSKKVQEASKQLSNTLSVAGDRLMKSFGNVIGAIGFGGNVGGYEAIAAALVTLSDAINDFTGNEDPNKGNEGLVPNRRWIQDTDENGKPKVDKEGKPVYRRRTETEEYGYKINDTEAEKEFKRNQIDKIESIGRLAQPTAKLVDGIGHLLGQKWDTEGTISTHLQEDIDKIRDNKFGQTRIGAFDDKQLIDTEKGISGIEYISIEDYLKVKNGEKLVTSKDAVTGEVRGMAESTANQSVDTSGWLSTALQTIFPQGHALSFLLGGQTPTSAANTTATGQPTAPLAAENLSQEALANAAQYGKPVNGAGGQGAGTQAAQQFATEFQQGMTQQAPMLSQGIQTALTTGMGQEGGGMQLAATQMALDFNTQFSQGLTAQPLDLTQYFSTITTQLQTQEAQFNTSGQNAGNQYSSGISSGMAGAAAAASAEAANILAAMDIAGEAYQKGYAAGQAFDEGYRAGGGIKSPGYASKHAKQEGLYLVGFLNDAVRPSYLAGQQVGNAFTEAFAPATELTESAYSVPKVNKENTASYMMSNNATPVAPRITNYFNIGKVDSKERVKEIAETVVKMATWNNETAGRSVQEE